MKRAILILLALALVVLSIWRLERADDGLYIRQVRIGDTPATLMTPEGLTPEGWVIVSHGFAGSRQMMQAISLTLARAGLGVLSFDSIGHGRHPMLLSPNVTRIEGTTAQLVNQMARVIDAAPAPVVALLGHSMATDIILRAGRDAGIGRLVAISMYSETLTAEWPTALLVVSGQFEGRLREVAVEAVRLVDADADEGVLASAGDVERRATVAPLVGHLGVLWSRETLRAARDWLAPGTTRVSATGTWIALLLLAWTAVGRLGMRAVARDRPRRALPLSQFWIGAALPLPMAFGLALLLSGTGLLGMAGFAPLAAALSVMGVGWLLLSAPRLGRPRSGLALFLLWALAFALLLDRYGAAFLPLWPRLPLALALLPATLAFALGEAALLAGAGLWRRIALRMLTLLTLGALVAMAPAQIGLVFTVLPVLVLFWLVFGTVARPLARRHPGAAGLGLGAALAWSIAASTPLFAT